MALFNGAIRVTITTDGDPYEEEFENENLSFNEYNPMTIINKSDEKSKLITTMIEWEKQDALLKRNSYYKLSSNEYVPFLVKDKKYEVKKYNENGSSITLELKNEQDD